MRKWVGPVAVGVGITIAVVDVDGIIVHTNPGVGSGFAGECWSDCLDGAVVGRAVDDRWGAIGHGAVPSARQ